MQLTSVFAIIAMMATAAVSVPTAHEKPSHPSPPQPSPVNQSNQCGNGATPYCCNTDNEGIFTTCKALSLGSQCSSTTVCCNANNSVQVCLNNAQIVL